MSEMVDYPLRPMDVGNAPWVDGCPRCDALRADVHPGLFSYVAAVADHFKTHGIALVGA